VTTEHFLRPHKAAEFLHQKFGFGAIRSLAKMRVKGGGPNYHRVGRLILYTEGDLLAWAESRPTGPHRSTSETVGGFGTSRKRGRPRRTPDPVAPRPAE
jgi:hypothetical protein